MRAFSIIALTLLAVVARGAEPAVEIEFEYALSFHDEAFVYLARLPDGKIHCEVLSRPEFQGETGERKWKKIKEVSVSADTFARLESAFDDPKLKHAGEQDWPAMLDGSRWRLKKKKGSLAVEILAHNPDMKPEGAPIVQLARSISAAASAGIFPK